jgi:hypothetical protein
MTGLDAQLRCVLAALDGDRMSAAVVRRNCHGWDWPSLRARVLRLDPEAGPEMDELQPPARAARSLQRPRLRAGTPAPHVLAECATWAATFGDESVAMGALRICAQEHGVRLDRDRLARTRRLVTAASARHRWRVR